MLMAPLPLTIAINDYDHVRDLLTGRVGAEGIALTALNFEVEEIFFRFVRFREWDISEMSMGKYVSLRAGGDDSLIAIPVFPSRLFRHSGIYVRSDGAVRAPGDLKGKRIGVPEWSQTAVIYMVGLLRREYGVALEDVDWVQAGVNEPGRPEKAALKLPDRMRLTRVADKTLNGMLKAGELDAVMSAHPPESYEKGEPWIRRLFEDHAPVELDYYRKTGIFPIMHTVAIRREAYDRHRWIAMNLLEAFEAAKRRSLARLREYNTARIPLPWLPARTKEIAAIFGEDFWPYGVEPNRRTLEAFLDFAHEQGVCQRLLKVEDLFAPETATRYRV
jgi:4,5-dihydroxyphthalate decarboxylase